MEKTRLSIDLDRKEKRILEKFAKDKGTTMTHIIRSLVKKWSEKPSLPRLKES